jgi:hypothetical protein
MDLFHKLIELVDKNSDKIPEGDYINMCDTIKQLRDKVKPPSFLLDQNIPLTYEPTHDILNGLIPDELPSDPDTAAQRDREQLHQHWREVHEEVMYPGLNQFLNELHEEWSDPVEPGSYYPPPRQTMHDDTTVAEAVMMEVD